MLPTFGLRLANICCSKQWHHPLCPVLTKSSTGIHAPTHPFSGDMELVPCCASSPRGWSSHLSGCDVIQSCAIFNLGPGHSAPLPVNTAQITVLESQGVNGLWARPSHQGLLHVTPKSPRRTGTPGGERHSSINPLSQHMGAEDMAVTKRDPHRALEGLRKALSKQMTK